MNVQTAFGIWLNSKTRLSFKKWMQKQGLTIVNPKVLVLLSLDAVDIVKIKSEQMKKGNPEEIFRWFSKLPEDEEFANLLDETVEKTRAELKSKGDDR